MLLIGESVLSLLIVDVSQGFDYYLTFFAGIFSIIFLNILHFQSQPHDPDQHAMRVDILSGVLFSRLYYVYSIALIVLGTTYKMFLFEFVYADVADTTTVADAGGEGRRSLWSSVASSGRWLAGSSGALLLDPDERRQSVTAFFSGSLAVVFFCMDALIVLHRGFGVSVKRVESLQLHNRLFGPLLTVVRIGIIALASTVFMYEQEPQHLSIIGLGTILGQLIIRAIGTYLFPPDAEEAEAQCAEIAAEYAAARISC